MNKTIIISIIFSIFVISGCAHNEKKDENGQVIKKERKEVNIDKKTETGAGKLFGNLGGKSNTFDFATSNVLWRASLKSLDFIPLNNVDYSGGVIISDWYSPNNTNESIKITVEFLSNELKVSSVKIKSFKKVCNEQFVCKTSNMSNDFNNKIKNKIIQIARKLKIEDETKKNN